MPHSPDNDFEHLLGPLDRIASALLPLATLIDLPGAQPVEITVGLLRGLYRQGVGIALDVIARRSAATTGEALDSYGRFVRWALGLVPAGERGVIRFFNVCYDGLLDGRVLAYGSTAGFTVSDQARGYSEVLLSPAGHPVWCLPLRAPTDPEYVVGGRAAVIYHPHGSLGWVRDPATGTVYKVPLPALRGEQAVQQGLRRSFYQVYAERGTTMEPVVVLTDRKSAEVNREPFFTAYAQLAAALATADAVVVAGYAFRDEPLNTVLAAGLANRSERLPPVLVFDRTADNAAYAQSVLAVLAPDPAVRAKLADRRLECWTGGLPGDLALCPGVASGVTTAPQIRPSKVTSCGP